MQLKVLSRLFVYSLKVDVDKDLAKDGRDKDISLFIIRKTQLPRNV